MAALLLASVWCALLLGAALGAPSAAGYAACVALLSAMRPRARKRAAPAAVLLAGAAGFVALPAWLALAGAAGAALGWALPAPPARATGPLDALAHVALAPLLEEWLYRERLLPALTARLGAGPALLLSSAAFAAPHLEPWSVLTAFGVGLGLGALQLATGRVALCVAAHAGLNAAVLVCGLPPARAALPPGLAALLSAGLLAFALAWTRVHARRSGAVRGAPAAARRLHPGHAWVRDARDSTPRSERSPSASRRGPCGPTASSAPARSTPS